MVVTDLFAVAHLFGKNMIGNITAKNGGGSGKIFRDCAFHIVRKIAAVRPGIGTQLLFIQGLQIIQGLLGSEAANPVGIPL